MKNLEEAMKTVDEAIEKISELHISDFVKIAKVLARKGNIHAHMQQYEEAIKCFEKSLLEDKQQKVKDELKKV